MREEGGWAGSWHICIYIYICREDQPNSHKQIHWTSVANCYIQLDLSIGQHSKNSSYDLGIVVIIGIGRMFSILGYLCQIAGGPI